MAFTHSLPTTNHSMLFSSVPDDLRAMSDELESLGGGVNARVGRCEVLLRTRPIDSDCDRSAGCRTVWPEGERVSVRDPRQPEVAASSKSIREYKLSHAFPLCAGEDEVYDSLGSSVLEWLWSGFNASVISYGQAGSGKTTTLFGSGGADPMMTESRGGGLMGRLLASLFQRIQSTATPVMYEVGLSCWEVLGDDEVVDLCDPMFHTHRPSKKDHTGASLGADNSAANGLNFTSVHADNLRTALEILKTARRRSVNWTCGLNDDTSDTPAPLPNRAHGFVRMILYDASQRRVSTLHMVDLVGAESLTALNDHPSADRAVAQLAAVPQPPHREAERRAISKNLSAFNRVIEQLATAEHEREARGGLGVVSAQTPLAARECKLTQIVCPLLAGNSRAWFLACARDGATHFLDTVNMLRVASRAMSVAAACVCLTGVELSALGFQPANVVLSAQRQDTAAAIAAAKAANDPPVPPHRAGHIIAEPINDSVSPPPTPDALKRDHEAWMASYSARREEIVNGDSATAAPPLQAPTAVSTSGVGAFENSAVAPHEGDQATAPGAMQGSINKLKEDIGGLLNSLLTDGDDPMAIDEPAVNPVAARRSPGVGVGVGVGPANLSAEAHPRFEAPVPTAAEEPHMPTVADNAAAHPNAVDASAAHQLLETNYASLLQLYKDQQALRAHDAERMKERENELLETCTQYELRVDDLRIEIIQLKGRLRKMENGSSFDEVFSQFERDILKLQKEVADVRERNVALEMQLHRESGACHRRSAGEGGKVDLASQRVKVLQREQAVLRKENDALKKRERQFGIHQRVAQGSQRKLNRLNRELNSHDNELTDSRLRVAELEAELLRTQEQLQETRDAGSALRVDHHGMAEELTTLQAYVKQQESDNHRADMLNRFIQKHKRQSRYSGMDVSRGGRTAPPPGARRAGDQSTANSQVQSLMAQLTSAIRRQHPALLSLVTRLQTEMSHHDEDKKKHEADLLSAMMEMMEMQKPKSIQQRFDSGLWESGAT